MKGQYAKIARVHARFYDEEIVYPILKSKIEYTLDIEAELYCNRILMRNSG